MVEVPERFLAPYVSALPPASELLGILGMAGGSIELAKAMASESVRLVQHGQAAFAELVQRSVELPPGVATASAQVWDLAVAFAQVYGEGGLRAALRQAMGSIGAQALALAARDAPVLGWIVQWGIFAAKMYRVILAEYKDAESVVAGPVYDPDADAAYVQQALDAMRGSRDWTWLWLPYAIGPDRSVKVQGHDVINRAWYIEGERVGWGGVPGVGRCWGQGWFFDTDTARDRNDSRRIIVEAHGVVPEGTDTSYMGAWDDYRPAVRQMAALLWSRQNATVESFFVDHQRIIDAWEQWDGAIRANWESGPDGSRRRRWSILRPLWAFAQSTKIQDCRGYNPFYDVMECTVLDVVRHYVREHYKRCEALLGTLACAYVSEQDAAFADADLRALLDTRRRQLLAHPALLRVDLGAIPDAEYRQAAALRWSERLPLQARGEAPSPAPADDPETLPDEPGIPPGGIPVPAAAWSGPQGGGAALAILAALLFV